MFISTSSEAAQVETSPHIFVDEIDADDWFLKDNQEIIFAGYGSPLFPNLKTHYLDYNSIKYGTLKDGRLIITCEFFDMYEFAIFYQGTPNDESRVARFMMRDTVDSNINPLEVDSVLAEFNGQYIDPFPPLGKNIIPNRAAEMLYYIVKGEKFFGNLDPKLFIDDKEHQNIINPYSEDLYERCRISTQK